MGSALPTLVDSSRIFFVVARAGLFVLDVFFRFNFLKLVLLILLVLY